MWTQSAVTPAEIHHSFFFYWIWKDPVFLGSYRLRSNSTASSLPSICAVLNRVVRNYHLNNPVSPNWISGKREVAFKACFYFIIPSESAHALCISNILAI